MKKKMRNILFIFDKENWLRKSNFGTFWELPVNPKLKTQNSKFNNFLLVCWFFSKILSYFVSLPWKLNNPYCHNVGTSSFFISKLKPLRWGKRSHFAASSLWGINDEGFSRLESKNSKEDNFCNVLKLTCAL